MTALAIAWTGVVAWMTAVVALRRAPALARRGPPVRRVLLVRPFAGVRGGVTEAIATWPRNPELEVSWVGCVADRDDPAWPLVQAAAAAHRDRGDRAFAMVTDARGPNRKAEQLAAAVAAHGEGHDAIVVVDADVDLASLDLAALVLPLGGVRDDGRTIGLAWSAPRETEATTLGDRVSAAILGASWQSFGLLARLDRSVVMGKAFAIRPETLARVGGFAALRSHLGEDFELGRRVEAEGHAVHLATTVRSLARDRSLAEVLERYARWLWVVRAQRPMRLVAYPTLLAAAPLLVLLACFAHTPAIAFALVATTVLCRSVVAAVAARSVGADARVAWSIDPWLADVLLLVALAVAATRRRVTWADRPLRVGRDGRLEAVRDAP